MSILKKIKVSNYTYFFLLLCFLAGYIKNILIIFSICLFHELGHVFFIKIFKYNIISIEILPFGGYTKVEKLINTSINKDIIIAFGGIIFQSVVFLIILLIKQFIPIITYNLIIKYNIIILFFNILPIIPLDGNNIIHLIFEKYFSYAFSYKINLLISILCFIIFSFINYYLKVDNYFILTFLIYKMIMYIKDFKYLKNKFLLERYLYNLDYKKICNHSRSVDDIKKEVYHYFKCGEKYINEKEFIKNKFFTY